MRAVSLAYMIFWTTNTNKEYTDICILHNKFY